MPTVLRSSGYRVVIYPNDHRPAHVHVIGKGHEALFTLDCPEGPVRLRENFGFAMPEVRSIQELVEQRVGQLCHAWEAIHGYA